MIKKINKISGKKSKITYRDIRLKLGYTQREWAKILGVSRPMLANVEIKKRNFSVKVIYRIIDFAKKRGIKAEFSDLRPPQDETSDTI
jgi:transcriptional regulator with XRE-family HTH domain